MSFEFSFYVRDRLLEYFRVEDLNNLELSDFPYKHTKEVVLDVIIYCSLNDFEQAKNNVNETLLFLNSGRRVGILQRLAWTYWKRCFIKTKLAVDKRPEQIESCKNFHLVLKNYKDFLSNFNGFNWTWYSYFVMEIRNWKIECDSLNNEYLNSLL